MLIDEITMKEFEQGLERTTTVIIPVGSTEEHGDHLPLGTDIMQPSEIVKEVSRRTPVFVAPPISYGVCRSTRGFPGTLGITADCLRLLLWDVINSLHENGLRNFIIISGHAGGTHMSAIHEIAEELLFSLPETNFMVLNDFIMAYEIGLEHGVWETEGDSHAGEVETSRMLASHPQLVKGSSLEEYPNFPNPILVRDKRKFWRNGVWGDPGKASSDKGKKVNELLVRKLVQLVNDLEKWQE